MFLQSNLLWFHIPLPVNEATKYICFAINLWSKAIHIVFHLQLVKCCGGESLLQDNLESRALEFRWLLWLPKDIRSTTLYLWRTTDLHLDCSNCHSTLYVLISKLFYYPGTLMALVINQSDLVPLWLTHTILRVSDKSRSFHDKSWNGLKCIRLAKLCTLYVFDLIIYRVTKLDIKPDKPVIKGNLKFAKFLLLFYYSYQRQKLLESEYNYQEYIIIFYYAIVSNFNSSIWCIVQM